MIEFIIFQFVPLEALLENKEELSFRLSSKI
jgi:hypothetical protein